MQRPLAQAAAAALVIVLAFSARARAAEPAPTAEFTFQSGGTNPDGVQVTLTGETSFLAAVHRTGGRIVSADGAVWQVDAAAPFGEGALDFTLDRTHLVGDLALVLRADWQPGSDVAIQLFDAAGAPLALDLFGNLAQNAAAAATDTFIVPLTRYPQATRLAVRRLDGPVAIHAAGLFPVLSELPASLETQQAIARQLGLTFALAGETSSSAGKPEKGGLAAGAPLGLVHATAALDQVNGIAAAALAKAGYPGYRPLADGALASIEMSVSGPTNDVLKEALRTLALRAHRELKPAFFTSSDGVAYYLLNGRNTFGLMSVPLTSAQKERFFADHGFPILEFKFARDAIEVLVNAANPLQEVTIPQLDAIYGRVPSAGADRAIRSWADVRGAGSGAINVYGGAAGWGTARAFQQFVLKGSAFREDIKTSDVVYRYGVEAKVGADPLAIGYATLRPRQADVRVLAIAANSGEKAWPVNAETIYSGHYPLQRTLYGYLARPSLAAGVSLERELINLLLSDAGQAMVARNGGLPLSAAETAQARADVGLGQ